MEIKIKMDKLYLIIICVFLVLNTFINVWVAYIDYEMEKTQKELIPLLQEYKK